MVFELVNLFLKGIWASNSKTTLCIYEGWTDKHIVEMQNEYRNKYRNKISLQKWKPGFSVSEKEVTNKEKGKKRMNSVVLNESQRYQ